MSSWVPEELRRLVSSRANRRCEYCLIQDADSHFGCEVDHVIAEKHGGKTVLENLAFACFFCNRSKGSDVATIIESGDMVRLFNPRTDSWEDHFEVRSNQIVGKTSIGKGTANILKFNRAERLLERAALVTKRRWP